MHGDFKSSLLFMDEEQDPTSFRCCSGSEQQDVAPIVPAVTHLALFF